MGVFGSPGDDETSPEVIADLRAIGALSAGEAHRHEHPEPPERQVRWEERLREPRPASGAYDAEMRFWKDAVYGRNREGPPPGNPPPPPPRPPERTAGVSFEETRLPRRDLPADAPGGVSFRVGQLPPRPAPAPSPESLLPPPSRRPERRKPALPVELAPAGARLPSEEEHRLTLARDEFVRDFRREHPRATESDADDAWEARRRASTIETD